MPCPPLILFFNNSLKPLKSAVCFSVTLWRAHGPISEIQMTKTIRTLGF
jgi:hypothetical protein